MSGKNSSDVVKQLESQHAVHGVWGRVFEKWGGEEQLLEWAIENPGKFLTLMTKMTPSMTPVNTIQGDVNLIVHQALVPTDLDSGALNAQGHVIEHDQSE